MRTEVRALMALARAKAAGLGRASNAAVLAALVTWFGSKDAVKATTLPERLIRMLVAIGIDREAAEQVGAMATVKALSGRSRHGAPQPTADMTLVRRVASEEPDMRARYVLAASKRLTDAIDADRYADALVVEKTYLAAHVKAGQNRRRAAKRVDDVAKDNNKYFVWRTAGDGRVEAACRAFANRIFPCDNPPAIPGAVHPQCRCWPEGHGSVPLLEWGTPK